MEPKKIFSELTDYETLATQTKKLERLIRTHQGAEVLYLVEELSVGELSNLILTVDPDILDELVAIIYTKLTPILLKNLNPERVSIIFKTIGPKDFCLLVNQLSDNDFYDLIHHNDSIAEYEELRYFLTPKKQLILEEFKSYPEHSAARLMQKELTYVEMSWSVKQIRDYLRFEISFLGRLNRIFIIDDSKTIVGTISLARLLKTPSDTVIKNVMSKKIITLKFDIERRKIMQLFKRYSLNYALVTSTDRSIIGAISIDQIVDLTEEEAEREKSHLQFVGQNEDSQEKSFLASISIRLPWLLVNLVFSMIVSAFIGKFSDVISRHIELAILIPIIASISNISGSQSIGTTIHSLARKDIRFGNIAQTFSREIFVTMGAALIMALLSGIVVSFRFNIQIALLYSVAMFLSFNIASLSGIIFPLTAHFLRLNPALVSPILVNTGSDFFSYLIALALAISFL